MRAKNILSILFIAISLNSCSSDEPQGDQGGDQGVGSIDHFKGTEMLNQFKL